MGSRWVLLLAPVVLALVFELVRLGVDGPTVDAIRLDVYGVLVLVAGRGVDAVLMLLPMLVGAGVGLLLFRRSAEPESHSRWSGRIPGTVGAALVMVRWRG